MMPRSTAAPAANSAALDVVFDELKSILTRYAAWFTVREGAVKDKRDYHLIIQKPLVIDGRKKDELWFASIIQQKHNVGVYFMPMYCYPKHESKLPPGLMKHLDGKCCFHSESLTPALKRDIEVSLKVGLAACQKRKWL